MEAQVPQPSASEYDRCLSIADHYLYAALAAPIGPAFDHAYVNFKQWDRLAHRTMRGADETYDYLHLTT